MRRTGIENRRIGIAFRLVGVNMNSLDDARVAAMSPGRVKARRNLYSRGFKSSRQPRGENFPPGR